MIHKLVKILQNWRGISVLGIEMGDSRNVGFARG